MPDISAGGGFEHLPALWLKANLRRKEPFKQRRGGLCAVLNQGILCNRRELINANGFILGTSGSGKSFAAKLEQWGIFLSTDDEIFVVDPEAEYKQLAESLGGEVIKIAAGSNHHINAMDMEQGYGDTEGKRENPLILKTQFVMSLCEQVMDSE